MNRVMKKTGMMMAMAAIISLGASCSDDNNENQSGDNALSVNEQKMEAIANQYITNTIYGSWCRTTPLWGRGLSLVNTGAEDRLHDCRARNEIEAIMWHGYSKDSQAYESAEKFYHLNKSDRDAVVKFLRSI